MSEPVIDREVLDGLVRMGGRELVVRMIDLFRDSVRDQRAAAVSALERGDLAGVARAAHSLRSSAGNLGASRLMRTVTELEALARDGDRDGARARIERLELEAPRAVEALAELRPGIERGSG